MTNASSAPTPTPNSKIRNLAIALVAIVLSGLIAFGVKSPGASNGLAALAARSVPYDQALTNGKPSLVEFYANWCSSCKSMAPSMSQLETTYGKSVNFVMLNVDNDKWLPEVTHYKVDGIPHFLYLNGQGNVEAQAIGEQPSAIVAENLQALINQHPLPHLQTRTGNTSDYQPPAATQNTTQNDDPRSHGAQVKTS